MKWLWLPLAIIRTLFALRKVSFCLPTSLPLFFFLLSFFCTPISQDTSICFNYFLFNLQLSSLSTDSLHPQWCIFSWLSTYTQYYSLPLLLPFDNEKAKRNAIYNIQNAKCKMKNQTKPNQNKIKPNQNKPTKFKRETTKMIRCEEKLHE